MEENYISHSCSTRMKCKSQREGFSKHGVTYYRYAIRSCTTSAHSTFNPLPSQSPRSSRKQSRARSVKTFPTRIHLVHPPYKSCLLLASHRSTATGNTNCLIAIHNTFVLKLIAFSSKDRIILEKLVITRLIFQFSAFYGSEENDSYSQEPTTGLIPACSFHSTPSHLVRKRVFFHTVLQFSFPRDCD